MKSSVTGIAVVDRKIFIAQRVSQGHMGGKWEFPGGKVEAGETDEQALIREYTEEFGVKIMVDGFIGSAEFEYNGKHTSRAYRITFLSEHFTLSEHTNWQWADADWIKNLVSAGDFVDSDVKLLPTVFRTCLNEDFLLSLNPMNIFQINQHLVYPSQGVGKIISIEEKWFKDNKIPYYVIYLASSDMTIMVPIERAFSLGIRPIVSPEESLEAINFIGEDYDPAPSDWKLRYQMNMDLLKDGSIKNIASIVRLLYHRSKIKELPIMERKLYDSALKILEDEIAVSLQKSHEEVERLIFEKLKCISLKIAGEGLDDLPIEEDADLDDDIE
ncbi:MAG: NUDIX domain-containing protein [Treponema sp.]|jgi:CarD family transcriptional regulator|nr:NUDIX domain-containing protein [Treponema sp.]